jgi:DMSO reductase anchor subunit
MGCGYCTWRCPYDAPRINLALGYIEKCHFCAQRSDEGVEPACVTACPTGALKMTESDKFADSLPAWFPDTGIKPSILIKNGEYGNLPYIIPADNELVDQDSEVRSGDMTADPSATLKKEWSLIAFSLLVITSSVMTGLRVLQDTVAGGVFPFILMAGAMIVSVMHLGRPERSWRAVLNLIASPLSREVVITMLLTGVTLLNWLKPGFIPPFISAILSILALISIDLVYFAADRSLNLRLHTGQAFFTTLYAVSWFTEPRIVFIIFSMLAAVSVVQRFSSSESTGVTKVIYYFRAMTLPLVFILIYPGNPVTDMASVVFFIAGLLADRLLFYIDFNPPKIQNSIREHFSKVFETLKANNH